MVQKKANTKQIEEEFETIWKMYPNKQGKMKALQSYKKARDKGTTYNEVVRGLERYLAYCMKEQWYRPKMGQTWFNGQCWLDEIDEGEADNKVVKDKFGNYIL